MPKVRIAFQVTGWIQEDPYDDAGPALSQTLVKKIFRGELKADSEAKLLMCQADASNPKAGAGYVASEKVVGTLGGKEGSFVMQHWGVMGADNPPVAKGHIIPESGTGELQGISGTVEFSADSEGAHELVLDYTL
ncbi:MAG: DUF3224 domain-containing protein [Candidatus Eisenbacteria bacterium]|uniref:DUF3224 domain-containing protein n=1 Tax=Eiseniibacteriota bacterium TaxID=2212470 RepID=A0A7Y2E6R1_UNCEI|nr:DUF3224 domain-containing protein [Candidatus Eisenbacteria bacterium]